MRPNFLIVGAAKAGTTSLYRYLDEHPDVFMCNPKEPKFFTSQILTLPHTGPGDARIDAERVSSLDTYDKLFEGASRARAIGEASADNLFFHQRVIDLIKTHCGNPKIVIILRNPVDRAISAYKFQYQQKREYLTFKEALANEEKRLADNWEFIWAYRAAGLYADGLDAFRKAFEHVKIIFNEDLRADPASVMTNLHEFLGVDPYPVRAMGETFNASKALPRSVRLQRWRGGHGFVGTSLSLLRRVMPPTVRDYVRKDVDRWMSSPDAQPSFASESRWLFAEFAEDCDRVRALTGRALHGWPTRGVT